MIFACFVWVFVLVPRVSVTCLATSEHALLTVALGSSIQLNCTFNCSNGFTQGYWENRQDSLATPLRNGSVCVISLLLSSVSTKDLERNYTCRTENIEDENSLRKIQLVVSLQLQAETSTPKQTETPTTTVTISTTTAKTEDEGGFIGIKVLATVTVAVALVLAVLAAFLCLSRNKQNCNCKVRSEVPRKPSSNSLSSLPQASHPTFSPVNGERVTLRIPTPDSGSDTEVPYADIMITVRGVSTPELNQVVYLTPGDKNQRWRDEPTRSRLQSSRSADRLHIPQPREISRKMSTNSEYAVITYA